MLTTRKLKQTCRQQHLLLLFLAVLLSTCPCATTAQQQQQQQQQQQAEYNDEYLNEVLQEAAEDHVDSNPYGYDDSAAEERQRQILEEEERRFAHARAEEEARQAEAAQLAREKVQQEREAAFEAELQKMNEENQKKARKQKRKDAKIVKRVLRAAERGDLYGVLGLRNWEVRMAPRSIRLLSYEFALPCQTFFHVSPKAIKRAYRLAARRVHPDKNRDGRAEEAFVAVEEAASILLDQEQRVVYDEGVLRTRQERRSKTRQLVGGAVGGAFRVVHRSISVVRRVLGPFAFPLFILAALMA